MTITRNSVLAALKTRLATISGATVIRDAARPEEHWEVLVKTSWPSGTDTLVVIWGAAALVDNVEKDGGANPQQQNMAVDVWCFVKDDDGEARDVKLCNLLDNVKNAVRADKSLASNALEARSDGETINANIQPPYAAGVVDIAILFRRS